MTDKLNRNLRAELDNTPKAELVSLCWPTSERPSRDLAREIGAEREAAIVIWGAYAVHTKMVDLWAHFVVLKKPGRGRAGNFV